MIFFEIVAKPFKINDQHVAKFLTRGRIVAVIPFSAALFAHSAFSVLVNVWYVLRTVLSVTLSQGVGLSSSIVPSVKISRTALLAASIAELGIRHAKGPSGLGKTL